MSFLTLAKIPDQIGYLVMNETGAIISSGGYLENNEKTAEAIFNLLTVTDKIEGLVNAGEGFTRISVVFNDFSYVISMSNRKIHVAMRKFSVTEKKAAAAAAAATTTTTTTTTTPPPPVVSPPMEPYLVDLQVPNNNSINA